jgi:hypothetical protein
MLWLLLRVPMGTKPFYTSIPFISELSIRWFQVREESKTRVLSSVLYGLLAMPVSNTMTVNPPVLRHRNTEISVILRHFSAIGIVPFEGFTMKCDLEIEISMILRY